jgi:hypothetical protein
MPSSGSDKVISTTLSSTQNHHRDDNLYALLRLGQTFDLPIDGLELAVGFFLISCSHPESFF